MTNGGFNVSLGNYWGVINSAAAQSLTTQQLWQEISAYEQANNVVRPAGLFQYVSQARSLAVSQRIAGSNLQNADDSAVIDASMIAQDYNARPANEQTLAPLYRVRFNTTVITSEGEATRWLTYVSHGTLPATKGDLLDLMNQTGVEMSTSYRGVFTGLTGEYQITAG